MAQQVNDVIHLCCKIADQPEFRNTLEKTLKGASITGAVAGLGALLFGPVGFALGGLGGGALAWWWTSGKFKSVPQMLKELPHAEKKKIYNDVVAVLDNLTWTDRVQLVAIVMGSTVLRERVTDVVLN